MVTRPITKWKRDFDDDDYVYHGFGGWYYSEEGRTIRYSILFGILLAFFTFLILAYFHARHRLKRGIPPLRYHRWLLSRQQRAIHEPHLREPEQNFSFYAHQQPTDYYMHAIPPPVYNPNYVQPPAYEPPPGASKANPAQGFGLTLPVAENSNSTTAGGPSNTNQQRA